MIRFFEPAEYFNVNCVLHHKTLSNLLNLMAYVSMCFFKALVQYILRQRVKLMAFSGWQSLEQLIGRIIRVIFMQQNQI